jgi:hypothetical protein
MEDDNRWDQLFANFNKALIKLSQAVEYISRNFLDKDEPIDDSDLGFVLDEMIKEGLIQRFEYTHELALNVMKLCRLSWQRYCRRKQSCYQRSISITFDS